MGLHYSYPKLSNLDYGWIRIGGPGLANCMFFAAKAYVYSRINKTEYIDPTWPKVSIGPWLRGEKDKRIYNNLFDHYGLRGIRKLLVIKHMMVKSSCVTTFSELGNYFGDLNLHYDLVKEYFDRIVRTNTIALVMNANLQDKVAIHVRLGDYLPELRIDISWYKSLIENIIALNPNQEFVLFSDGTDQELAPLLQLPNVKKSFMEMHLRICMLYHNVKC